VVDHLIHPFFAAQSTNGLLASKANSEIEWINRVNTHSKGKFAVIPWMPEELKGNKLKKLYK